MSEFTLLKYKVEDLSSEVAEIKAQLTRSKCIAAVGNSDEVIVSCGVLTTGTLLSYEVIALDGEDISITLSLDGELLSSVNGKVLTGDVLVRGRRLHNFMAECRGSNCKNARLRLEGAGLKLV